MKTLIKLIFTTLLFINTGICAQANNADEAKAFFNKYVESANSYSTNVPRMYDPNAKIIRQVIKPDGKTVNVPFTNEQYQKQLKISSASAKLKKYKNYYSNISVTELNGTTYRIDADRQPSTGGGKLKASITVQKQSNGNWLIIRELMQTREQIFLKYAK